MPSAPPKKVRKIHGRAAIGSYSEEQESQTSSTFEDYTSFPEFALRQFNLPVNIVSDVRLFQISTSSFDCLRYKNPLGTSETENGKVPVDLDYLSSLDSQSDVKTTFTRGRKRAGGKEENKPVKVNRKSEVQEESLEVLIITNRNKVFHARNTDKGNCQDISSALNGEIVKEIFAVPQINTSCSWFLLTEFSDLYGFGNNSFGNLGLGHCKDVELPVKLPFLGKAMELCGGPNYSIILDEDSNLWLSRGWLEAGGTLPTASSKFKKLSFKSFKEQIEIKSMSSSGQYVSLVCYSVEKREAFIVDFKIEAENVKEFSLEIKTVDAKPNSFKPVPRMMRAREGIKKSVCLDKEALYLTNSGIVFTAFYENNLKPARILDSGGNILDIEGVRDIAILKTKWDFVKAFWLQEDLEVSSLPDFGSATNSLSEVVLNMTGIMTRSWTPSSLSGIGGILKTYSEARRKKNEGEKASAISSLLFSRHIQPTKESFVQSSLGREEFAEFFCDLVKICRERNRNVLQDSQSLSLC